MALCGVIKVRFSGTKYVIFAEQRVHIGSLIL